MDKLYSWKAKRAGGHITVEHSCGKIVGIDAIEVRDGKVIAAGAAGGAKREFELHVA